MSHKEKDKAKAPVCSSPEMQSTATGCCIGCGSGKTSCNDECIRKLAEIECKTACSSGHSESNTKSAEEMATECLESCCQSTSISANSEPTGACKDSCCDNPTTDAASEINAERSCCSSGNQDSACNQNAKSSTDTVQEDSCCRPVLKSSVYCAGESQKRLPDDETADACCSSKPNTGCCGGSADEQSCSGNTPNQSLPSSSKTSKGPVDGTLDCKKNVDSCCITGDKYPAKEAVGMDSCCSVEAEKACCEPKSNVADTSCTFSGKESCCTMEANAFCSPEKSRDHGQQKEETDTCCTTKNTNTCSSRKDACCPGKSVADDCCGPSVSDRKCAKPMTKRVVSRESIRKSPVKSSSACDSHLQKAFDKYASYLEKGQCICRSVLDRLDVCCGQPTPKRPSSKSSVEASANSNNVSPSKGSVHHRVVTKEICKASCCEEKVSKSKARANAQPTSGIWSSSIEAEGAKPPKEEGRKARPDDIEHAAAREHVVLGVSGMTCTGCSKKLMNVLHKVDGVSSPIVTFVTGIAEFDVDQGVTNVNEVVSRIGKQTGFKFKRVVSEFQTLDLKVDQKISSQVEERLQELAETVEKLDKSTCRITYDPVVIGARSLLLSLPASITLAPPERSSKLSDHRKKLVKLLFMTGLAAALTIPVAVLSLADVAVPYPTRSVICLVLATIVQGLAIPEFYMGAMKALVYSRVLEMDMLVVISTTAAYGYSVVAFGLTHAGIALETGEFFEISTLLITLILLGRLVAASAKVKAVSSVSLRSLQSEKALLVTESGTLSELDARLLQFEDLIVVLPHSRIVTDGVVVEGNSEVDESMLTGESIPVSKTVGKEVIAGTINGTGKMTIRITRLPGKNNISDIAEMVENALAVKPRIQDLADRLAGYFVPFAISISLIVFVIWIAVALRVRHENGGGAVGTAITYSIAVMAVSCPCALGLAVPMVLVIAGGTAARSGIVIRQADTLERGHKVTDVVFDKTGTITKGDLAVVHKQTFPSAEVSETEAIALTEALLRDNQHPVSQAVSSFVLDHSKKSLDRDGTNDRIVLSNLESIPGVGIKSSWNGAVIRAGNPHWLKLDQHPEVTKLMDQGMTLLCVTIEASLIAVFGLKGSIRDEASSVVAYLGQKHIRCHIVSGDNAKVVEDTARTVGIPLERTASRHSPAQKQEYVKSLMSAGKVVLFCGDGTNDAVAVAQANVGVQLGTASDVTNAVADVVLLSGLEGIPTLLDISKRSSRRIAFNFAWAGIYNLFAMLLASGAFVKARIPAAYAGLGEIVSVMPVIAAALTLARAKKVNLQ